MSRVRERESDKEKKGQECEILAKAFAIRMKKNRLHFFERINIHLKIWINEMFNE